ncbi:polyprenyl synthetase family protein [Humisphaera borealis]|uniref:Polyprenyl synthetase family protein n=1 Tax=Humisphaera borealis TaxID=2807512 RepID=A0A7M2X567_9BACT|nr:polyprenyl synthetase family protein [Humisphaera borealis]QOV92191.1 polyprenyl synthetase family protein [Humisphaera borealis]
MQHLETRLDHVVGRVLCDDDGDVPGSVRRPMVELMRQFVLEGGKRIRPQLCLWSYRHASGNGENPDVPPAIASDVACAWELFHTFLLCHDDIIDGADRRRGRPTLHHRLASLDGGSMIFGANLGIVAGDLLFVGSMRLLHELDLESAKPALSAKSYQRLLRLFSRVACETGFGQAIDIVQSHVPLGDVDEAVVLKGYDWKTAAYTFEGPMLSGAILAGLDEPALAAVSRFAMAIGQAYQLHNDLLDLRSEAHEGSDLVQGKRTPTLLRARLATPEDRRVGFDQRVEQIKDAGVHAVAMAEAFRQELLGSGAVRSTQSAIEALLADAAAATADPALPPRFSSAMSGLLAAMAAKYFAPVLI